MHNVRTLRYNTVSRKGFLPMRLNFEFNDAQVESLNALKKKTGASSMKDLFNNALTILEWTVDETAQGKEIVATDGKTARVFVTPLLRQVKVNRAIETGEGILVAEA